MPEQLDLKYPKPYENHIRAVKLVWNEEEERALGPDWHLYEPDRKKEPWPRPRS